MEYGETVKTVDSTIYVVESKWPDREGWSLSRWACYSPTAFNDKRNPNKSRDGYGNCDGTFDRHNEKIASHPSRVGHRLAHKWKCGDFGDAPAFTDPEAALAYAARLAKYGECAAIYGSGGTDAERLISYSGKIRVRVVEQRMAAIDRVVVSA